MSTQTFDYREKVDQSMTYESYRQLTNELFAAGKTTGPNQTESLLHYTKLNIQRMSRLDKTTHLTEDVLHGLQAIAQPQIWLVLTESWCGDASQIVPVMNHMAEASEHIELRILLRDEHLELMDRHLTNGGRSIPKLIALDAQTYEVIGEWGPRPAEVQEKVMAHKQDPNPRPYAEVAKEIQVWYNRDKTVSVQEELLESVSA